jgi:hypothetical protein
VHAAERVPGACPAAGTVIVTSINTTYTFKDGDGLQCSGTWAKSGQSGDFKMFGLVTLVGSGCYSAAKDQIATLWPLDVGKVVRISGSEGEYRWTGTYTVTEKKDITVKAGTFPVYVVSYDEQETSRIPHRIPFHGIWTFYISTEVGYFVKHDYKQVTGKPLRHYPHTPWEAVSITRPDAPAQRSE